MSRIGSKYRSGAGMNEPRRRMVLSRLTRDSDEPPHVLKASRNP